MQRSNGCYRPARFAQRALRGPTEYLSAPAVRPKLLLVTDTARPTRGPLEPATGHTQFYPVFFPSVSSLKTPLAPSDAVRLLKALNYPRFLVSAHDVATDRDQHAFTELLYECRGAGAHVLLDSGNYEAYWTRDVTWTQERFHQILRLGPANVAFSFDHQFPPEDVPSAVSTVTANATRDGVISPSPIVPIIHGRRDLLPDIAKRVRNDLNALAVAVPERELGFDIRERVQTLRAIRMALGPAESTRLHLLGTGNPSSILAYALTGADSFDGLEWCQTVVDHRSGLLHHLSHYPLFQDQTEWGTAPLSPLARALAHNLAFFRRWEQQLGEHRERATLETFAKAHFPEILTVITDA